MGSTSNGDPRRDVEAFIRLALQEEPKRARRRPEMEQAASRLGSLVRTMGEPGRVPVLPDPVDPTPVPALLWCYRCGEQHIDRDGWETVEKAHRTHLCVHCGHLWLPYLFASIGVDEVRRGDVVAWRAVPTHSLVKHGRLYSVRIANRGWIVGGFHGDEWDSIEDGNPLPWCSQWGSPWIDAENGDTGLESATIVATLLRGDESGNELRALAGGI